MLSQSQLSILSQSLMTIDFEIRSTKTAVREKALGKIHQMLDNRSEDLVELLSSSNPNVDLTWSRLFETAHESIIDASTQLAAQENQRKLTTLKGKATDQINIIQKIVSLSSEDHMVRISPKLILQKSFQCFRNRSMVQYFGECYLQIVTKHVLFAKADLSEIKGEEWSELLSRCFKIYDYDFFTQKLILLQCITAVIDIGLRYVPLVLDLPKYLPQITKIASDEHKSNATNEVYRILYIFCMNLALDHRFAICELTENVISTIIKNFPKVAEDTKKLICKLLHIILTVHNPKESLDSDNKCAYATCNKTWNLHIRNMIHLVQNEVLRLRNNRLANSAICNNFVLFASKLCSVAFWSMSVWDSSSMEAQRKRHKCNDKLQGIMDLVNIKTGVFCWRWLKILSELLTEHPESVTDADFQPLLQLLVDFQGTIETPIQIETLRKIVKVLLIKESTLQMSKYINENLFDEVWLKIAQNASRTSATNRPNFLESTKLLQTLVTFKRLPSTLIQSILEMYLSSYIPKTNESISLIISIFQHTNIDSLNNSDRIRTDTLNWLHTTSMAMELKNISSCDVIDVELKAELSVLCLFSKVDASFFPTKIKCKNKLEHLEEGILFRSLKKMIFSQSKQDGLYGRQFSTELTQLNQIRSIMNETYVRKFEAMLTDVDMTNNPLEDVISVVSSLHFFVLILNDLIAYGALNEQSVVGTYFAKKMEFKIEQMEICMSLLAERNDSKENMEIIEKLCDVFNENIHPVLAKIIKSHSTKTIVDWLSDVVNRGQERNSRCLLLKTYDQLKFQQKVRFKAFALLSYLTDSVSGNEAYKIINEYEFNLLSNGDLCIVLNLIQAMAKRPKLLSHADWIFKHLKELCMLHHKSNQISEQIIDLIPIVVEYINTFTDMTDEMISIIRDFMKKIKKSRYSPKIIVKMLSHMRCIAKHYSMNFGNEEFESLFVSLKDFLDFQMLDVQLASIASIIDIFDKSWMRDNSLTLNLKQFQRNFFNFVITEVSENMETEDLDHCARHICVRGQLIAGLISSSNAFRKEIWFLLAEFCLKHQMNSEKIGPIISALCEHHKTNHDMLVNGNVCYLMSQWFIRKHSIMDFPWYLTTKKSQQEFLRDNVNALIIGILRHQPSALDDFAAIVSVNTKDLLTAVLPNCLAYLIPILAGCDKISEEYRKNEVEMSRILRNTFGELKDILRINFLTVTQNLLSNLWDSNVFKELFDLEIDFDSESYNIDNDVFTKSLEYLQSISESSNKGVHLITDLCANRPLQIYNFLLFKKLDLQNTKYVDQQLIHLFHCCVVMDKVALFFVSDDTRSNKKNMLGDKKASLLRDIVYFLCNLLIDSEMPPKLKLAVCKYYRNFAGKILPTCTKMFQPFLNFSVSSLVPLVQHNVNSLLSQTALECIKYFVIDQRNVLADEISLLDNFPQNDEFSDLRQTHFDVKYRGKTFSLTEEIECFLKVDHRKIEGLVALKEQLSLKKHELTVIYNELQDMSGFTEDCDKSLIHRLVFTLLKFVQGSDPVKAVEAAKCLGELGPSDLSSIVLKSEHQMYTYEIVLSFGKATELLCRSAFTELNRLLLHPDVKVQKAVSSCLTFLLKSDIGKSLLENFSYLHLFHEPTTQKESIYTITGKKLDLEQLIAEDEYSTHSVWLKRFMKVLFDLFGCNELEEVAMIQTSFADAMLPLLVKMILVSHNNEFNRSLQKAVLGFFQKHSEMVVNPPRNTKQIPIYLNKATIKCMITVAECIRIYNLNASEEILLQYQDIARSAQYCGAYFTSIMYAELWALQIEASSQYTRTQIRSVSNFQEIMKKAYISIGDMDAVSSFLDPISSRETYLQLTDGYDQISLRMDVDLANNPDSMKDLNNHLVNSGLFALANILPQKSIKQYECAWRLGDWNILNQMNATNSDDFQEEFEKQHYLALKCLQTKDEMGVRGTLKIARQAIISFLKHLSLECTNNIYHHLERLTLLQQIEDFCQVQFDKPDPTVPNIFIKWKHQEAIPFSDFKYKEPILAQRITIVKSAGIRATRKLNTLYGEHQSVLHTMLLNLASECRLEGNKNLAIRYLASLNSICTTEVSKAKTLLEDAQLNWNIGDKLLAKRILSRLLNSKDVESYYTSIISRNLLGEYKATSYSDSVETIIHKNFNCSLEMMDKLKENRVAFLAKGFTAEFIDKFIADNQIKAYDAIAMYSDREYNQICVHMKSNKFEMKMQTMAKNEELLTDNRQVKTGMSTDNKRALTIMSGNVNIDKKEVKGIETDRSRYLILAISNYLKTCYLRDEFNDATVFRIISLWFSNKSNANVTTIVKTEIPKIASYKFLPALPQIAARIASGNEDFNSLIAEIIVRCATDHPQQTLYQLLSLANAYADDPIIHKNTKEARVLGARKLLEKLNRNKRLVDVISQMELMCSTLVTLANAKLTTEKGKERILSKDLSSFRALSKLNLVHCPTLILPISKSGSYDNLISIHCWDKNYSLCGGINAPLKISCLCSNGLSYEQLLKGKDDLRQDAVMQQVFTIMNNMLRSNKETHKRKLHIKTYKIVPFSQRSGILEWCANTTTMSDYLTSPSSQNLGAHQRFYPNDLPPNSCRRIVSNYRTQKKSIEDKLSEFKDICSKFHPVFHNYFLERFLRPGMWFERRLAYINSVATTSMIGYILGIGDRHISNILIDQNTAELIHIDFGIAFEQARILPTPEKIPFRLTRDIVDGFGVSGVDGVFRKSCEKTMEVLRNNKSTIITILEVLLYDPLHMWTLTLKEASKRQHVDIWATEEASTGDKKNAMAERALLRLEAKLIGQEEGLLTQQLTTEGQVDMLIQQAMNPLNLCQMFEGWQAYV